MIGAEIGKTTAIKEQAQQKVSKTHVNKQAGHGSRRM
jgi:hypothetical protein